MAQQRVTMQLDLGHDFAGDWANRTRTNRASTLQAKHRDEARLPVRDALLLRLYLLRSAIEALRAEPFGETLAATNSIVARMRFATPCAYNGLYFALGGFAEAE